MILNNDKLTEILWKEILAPGPETMIISLIGQPNCGKSTIFNYFSGYKAAVSNFPGTTVKYTVSRVVFEGDELTCVDLPGVYSLTSIDPAERGIPELPVGREIRRYH